MAAAIAKSARVVTDQGTGAHVSSKSRPGTWLKPCAIRRALYLVTLPSESRLMSYTYRVLTALRLLSFLILDHVPSFLCAKYSSFSAAFHSGQSERARASFALVGGLLRSQADLAPPKGPAAT